MIHNCPLCNGSGEDFYRHKKRAYYRCKTCHGLYVDRELIPDPESEKLRYEEHNNDVEDEGYLNFVSPIISTILNNHTQGQKGLDFGAGTGPVIASVLRDNNYSIDLYDPFFHNHPALLTQTYDYIVCCEVIEHFHQPEIEFSLLRKLLNPRGKLYCFTDIYHPGIDFHLWYYKNDMTHVFIYQKETLEWIQKNLDFTAIRIKDRLITYYR